MTQTQHNNGRHREEGLPAARSMALSYSETSMTKRLSDGFGAVIFLTARFKKCGLGEGIIKQCYLLANRWYAFC